MSINDATNVASATAASSISSVKKLTKSLSNNIFSKTLHQLRRKCYKNFYAKSYDQLPIDTICELNTEIIATYSGPDNGISDVSLVSIRKQLQQQQQKQQELNENSNKQTSIEKENNVLTNLENDNQTINQNPNKLSETSKKNENDPILNEANNNTNTAEKEDVINEKALINECLDSFYKSNIKKWNVHHHRAYGIACSLYETNPVTKMNVGEPIADVFATITRRNSSILILADGVNWGPRSRLAARAAVRASMNYINRNLFFPINSQNDNFNNLQANNHSKYLTTHDLFRIMCRSFDAAQDFILQKKGTMTTLCCSIVVKLKDSSASSSSSSSSMWAVCTLSIGDSTAYVFNRTKGIFELTYGARNLNDDRDMRNVGGALGHVYGIKPDVSNLNYSIMYIKENDIVFLVSDGVSDNLDPIVSQTARKRPPNDSTVLAFNAAPSIDMCNNEISSINASPNKDSADSTTRKSPSKTTQTNSLLNESTNEKIIDLSSLPVMSPYERYVCSLAHMNEILLRNKTPNDTVSAQETCAILIEHVMKLTANKRQMLESGLLEASNLTNDEERLKYQAILREKVQKLRGKLDHASIVAYEVGTF